MFTHRAASSRFCKIHHLNTNSIIFNTQSLVFDKQFLVFNTKFVIVTHLQNSSFLMQTFIILNTQFLIFDMKLIVFNTKFVIFTHRTCDGQTGRAFVRFTAPSCSALCPPMSSWSSSASQNSERSIYLTRHLADSSVTIVTCEVTQIPEVPTAGRRCKIHHFKCTIFIILNAQFLVLIHNFLFLIRNSSFLLTVSTIAVSNYSRSTR